MPDSVRNIPSGSQRGIKVNKLLVFQSDFGLSDGAVAAMYGVALSVDETLKIYDLTHEIPPFDTFEASYRLLQAVPFWPASTVFVTVVDPGVGSSRRSIVVRTKGGHYIVTPDNGSISHIARSFGIESVRQIAEDVGRRKNSEYSHTFHGRDIYGYTGALLASGKLAYDAIGPYVDPTSLVLLEGLYPQISEDSVTGTIETLDVRFGSLWTNISGGTLEEIGIHTGDLADVTVMKDKSKLYHSFVMYSHTFADVEIGEPLLYINSMNHIGVAINQGNFARAYNIGTREPWHIQIRKIKQ